MQNEEIRKFVSQQSEIEFPAFQKAFSLTYGEAKSIIADLEKDGLIKFKAGVVYTVLSQPPEAAPSHYKPKTDFEAKCINALWVCINEGTASTSCIQRKCNVGYLLAMNIVEWLEKNKYISQYPNRRPLISKKEFINKFGKPEGYDEDGDSEDNTMSASTPGGAADADTNDDGIDIDNEVEEFIRNLDDDDDGPDIPDVKSVLSENISRSVSITPSGKYVLDLNGKFDIWFEFIRESNVMRISDDGAAFMFTSLSDKRIQNAIKRFPQVQYAHEIVFIDEPRPAEALKSVLTLYSALDYLFKLK